jgi:hypothetical protein
MKFEGSEEPTIGPHPKLDISSPHHHILVFLGPLLSKLYLQDVFSFQNSRLKLCMQFLALPHYAHLIHRYLHTLIIYSVPERKFNRLAGHRIGHSAEKVYMYMCAIPNGFRDRAR